MCVTSLDIRESLDISDAAFTPVVSRFTQRIAVVVNKILRLLLYKLTRFRFRFVHINHEILTNLIYFTRITSNICFKIEISQIHGIILFHFYLFKF